MSNALKAIILFLALPFCLKGHDFFQEVEKLKGLPQEEFLNLYPFRDYISVCLYHNIQELESHKQYLDHIEIDGKAFIYRLYQEYMAYAEVDFKKMESIKKLLAIGEVMSISKQYLHPDSAFVYVVVGDLIFSALTDSLETLLNEKKIDKNDFEVQYIIERLNEHQFLVNIPVSNWEKFWKHFRNGNFSYIWQKATGTYIREFFIFLGIIALIVSFCIYLIIRQIKKRKLKKSGVLNAFSN